MSFLKWLPLAAIALLFSVNYVSAEQVLLSDGRYLQGDVVEVKKDGFTFKLTESGGQIFLRWNQVDAALEKRLTNQQDPDEGLNLEVTVLGARLELIDGSVYEGDITHESTAYRVKNFDLKNGKQIPEDDVLEDGFIKDIQINALVMLSAQDVLTLAESQRDVENAEQPAKVLYELARIADRLALYQEAKDFVTLALASTPDAKLQARLTEYDTQLDELIRQAAVLELLVEARARAKKKEFQLALNILTEAKNTFKPTGPVLSKVDETFSELDAEFTEYVIDEWYKQMKAVATAHLKLKENKEITAPEAANWSRRQMDIAISEKIMGLVGGSDPADIKKRFMERFSLEQAKLVKLTMKKASFGKDGFYQNVGGHLQIAGKKPADQPADPTTPPRGRDRDGISDPAEGYGFQGAEKKKGPLPDGIKPEDIPDDIKDALRRALEEDDNKDGESGDKPKAGRPDLNKLAEQAPQTYRSLEDWWKSAGTTTRAKWMVACYVTNSGTMTIYEWPDWDVKFK